MQKTTVNYGLMFERIPTVQKARIHFNTPYNCKVLLKIMQRGEGVRLLLNETVKAGKHIVEFNFSHLPNETYQVKLIVETQTSIDKETIAINI